MASRSRVESPPHFFKVILKSTLEDKKLRIPEKFVRMFGDELSAVATLAVPTGDVWQVQLAKDGKKIWFHDGWHDFVEYHSIGVGYFLVFEYKKNSDFSVLIFDMSACEIEYPYNVEEPENHKENSIHQYELDSEDSAELMDLAAPNPPLNSLKNKYYEKRPTSSNKVHTPLSQQNQVKPSFVSGSKKNKCRREEPEDNKKSTAEDIDIKLKKPVYEVGTHSSYAAETKFNEGELLVFLEDMGICVNKRFSNLAAEDKERASAAAGLFKPKKPSFMVFLRASDLYNCHVCVPAPFAHRYFSRTKFIKLLDSEGRKWPVEIVWTPLCFITRLGGFKMKLDEGDVCIFESMRQKILKVSILKRQNRDAGKLYASSSLPQTKKHKIDRSKFEKDAHNGEDEHLAEAVDEKELLATLENSGISIHGKHKYFTAEQRERAIDVARLFKSRNPSFMILLHSSHLSNGPMYVPISFANKYLGKDTKWVNVQVPDGREFPLLIGMYGGSWRAQKGWHPLVRELNAHIGDICVFELVRVKDTILKASVFSCSIE